MLNSSLSVTGSKQGLRMEVRNIKGQKVEIPYILLQRSLSLHHPKTTTEAQ